MRERIEQIKQQKEELLQVLEAKSNTVKDVLSYAKTAVNHRGLSPEVTTHLKRLKRKVHTLNTSLNQNIKLAIEQLTQISEADINSIQELGLDPYPSNKEWNPIQQASEFIEMYSRICELTIRAQEYKSQIETVFTLDDTYHNLEIAQQEMELQKQIDGLYKSYDKFLKTDSLIEVEHLQLTLQHQLLMYPKGRLFDFKELMARIVELENFINEIKEARSKNPHILKKLHAFTLSLKDKEQKDQKIRLALRTKIEEYHDIVNRIQESIDRNKRISSLINRQSLITQKKQEILQGSEQSIKTTVDILQQHLVEFEPVEQDRHVENLLKKVSGLEQILLKEVKRNLLTKDKLHHEIVTVDDLLTQAEKQHAELTYPLNQKIKKLDELIHNAETAQSMATLTDPVIVKTAEELISKARQRQAEYQNSLDLLNQWFGEANQGYLNLKMAILEKAGQKPEDALMRSIYLSIQQLFLNMKHNPKEALRNFNLAMCMIKQKLLPASLDQENESFPARDQDGFHS